jgi:hypothetical protein
MIMRAKIGIIMAALGAISPSVALARGFGGFHGGGFGGFHGGGFGGGFGHFSSFHAGGFGGGFGSVHYSGFSHYGPATGFTHHSEATHVGYGGVQHYGGATHVGYGGAQHYSGWGGYHDGDTWGGYHAAATYHPYNYGSVAHYGTYGYHVPGVYGGWGHGAVYHGPYGGSAAYYHGPVVSGAVVHGPAGGTYAAYRGPFSAGAVASLPSGYTAVAWHGDNYYHYGYNFYHPYWYGGTVAYVPIYPPVGFFYATLPTYATPTVIENNTYYTADGVYYQATTQNGQQGYAVVAAPTQTAGAQSLASPAGGGPDPLQLLQKFSSFMGDQKHIIMKIRENFDEVTNAGQKIQLSTERKIWLERPDKLEVKVNGTGVQRRVAYNGTTFTIIDLMRNVFASVPMSGSLDSALEQMAKQYGMAQPADDLLYNDLYAVVYPQLQTGQYLGKDWVDGHRCDHVAYTQFGVHWELWVEDGMRAIPRKLVVTYVGTPGRPQYVMRITDFDTPVLMWGADYSGNPPPGATSASMLSLTGVASSQ